MITTERTKEIRTKLKKAHGITSRQVSVRTRHGSSINVDINDPEVDIKEVENIAKGYENYQRCHVTGEILGGGNTFVFIDYTNKAKDAAYEAKKEFWDGIADVFVKLEPHSGDRFDGILIMKESEVCGSISLPDAASGLCLRRRRFHIQSEATAGRTIAGAYLEAKGLN